MKAATKIIIFGLIVVFTLGTAYAHFDHPENAVKYRKAVMFLIAQHFKRIAGVVKGKTDYDQASFAQNAEVLKTLATMPWEASLEPGTDKGDTTLSSAVFSKKDDYMKAAQSFEAETAKLAEMAAAGDLDAAKAQFGTVAGNCKSCHSKFRSK